MPLGVARKLLPPNAIIGVSCTTPEHARKAVEDGADYVGLGAVYATSTKDVSAPGSVCGIAGVRAMLGVLEGTGVKAVAIGSYQFLLPFTLLRSTLWNSDGMTLMRELRRRYQIDEPASHAAQLCFSHWPRSSWCCCRVRHCSLA
jgi:hypothetical protein